MAGSSPAMTCWGCRACGRKFLERDTRSMLSRTGEGLYWMGSYLERAQHGCHLLTEQFIIIEDWPVEPIDQSWRRLYMAAGRTPLGGHPDPLPDDEDFMLADAYTLGRRPDLRAHQPQRDPQLRRRRARECPAGAQRHRQQDVGLASTSPTSGPARYVEMETIWNDRPDTFYRPHRRRHPHLLRRRRGHHVPRRRLALPPARALRRAGAVGLAALVDAHIALFPTGAPDCEILTGARCSGSARRALPTAISIPWSFSPTRMVDFLVADPALAHSIRYALGRIVEALDAVAPVGPAASDRSGAARGPDGCRNRPRLAQPRPRRTTVPRARRSRRSANRAASCTTTSWPPTSTTRSRTRRERRHSAPLHWSSTCRTFTTSEPAQGSLMVLRLHPREDGGQQCRRVHPQHRSRRRAARVRRTPSATLCHLFNIHRAHEHTSREARRRRSSPRLRRPCRRAWRSDAWEALAAARRAARPLGVPGTQPLRAFEPGARGVHRRQRPPPGRRPPLLAPRSWAARCTALFRYEPGSTAVDSPIEHILETGRGVCQDYTHVMITIARSWGIPSRYVSGYLHREGAPGEQTPEGASHAWAEFLLPDLGLARHRPDQQHPGRPPPCPHRRGPRLCRCRPDAGRGVRRRGVPARRAW